MFSKTAKSKLILVFLIHCAIYKVYGQNYIRKNHLSFDPIQPLFGTLQFQYERPILNKISVSLTAGYKFSSGLLNIADISFQRFETDEFNFEGIKLIPEIRWYTQKSHIGLTGFFVGAYFRYQNRIGDIEGDYTSLSNEVSRILIEANLNTSNIGIEIGYKLEIKNGFFIDFIIAGPGISFNNLELIEIEPVPDAFYDDINETLRDIGIIDLLDSDFRINGNQKTSIPTLAFRYGIKLGYAF